jgi:hypothetical protein
VTNSRIVFGSYDLFQDVSYRFNELLEFATKCKYAAKRHRQGLTYNMECVNLITAVMWIKPVYLLECIDRAIL